MFSGSVAGAEDDSDSGQICLHGKKQAAPDGGCLQKAVAASAVIKDDTVESNDFVVKPFQNKSVACSLLLHEPETHLPLPPSSSVQSIQM